MCRRQASSHPNAACIYAQVRRGDFAAYCLLVEMRSRAEGEPANLASCAPTAHEIAVELAAAEAP